MITYETVTQGKQDQHFGIFPSISFTLHIFFIVPIILHVQFCALPLDLVLTL